MQITNTVPLTVDTMCVKLLPCNDLRTCERKVTILISHRLSHALRRIPICIHNAAPLTTQLDHEQRRWRVRCIMAHSCKLDRRTFSSSIWNQQIKNRFPHTFHNICANLMPCNDFFTFERKRSQIDVISIDWSLFTIHYAAPIDRHLHQTNGSGPGNCAHMAHYSEVYSNKVFLHGATYDRSGICPYSVSDRYYINWDK